MVRSVRPGLIGLRDRAMLLLGFAGAFRRSELAAPEVSDLALGAARLEVRLRRSKTDQEGVGRKVGIPHGSVAETCPVGAVKAWLEAAGITQGPILREIPRFGPIATERLSGLVVARVVKRAALAAGLDPRPFSGHALRAGLATSAAKAGESERAIMKQSGHRPAETVRRYIRDSDLFSDNAATGIGLWAAGCFRRRSWAARAKGNEGSRRRAQQWFEGDERGGQNGRRSRHCPRVQARTDVA